MHVTKKSSATNGKPANRKGAFDDMAAKVTADAQAGLEEGATRSAQRVLGSHRDTISSAGKKRKVKAEECDPARLRMWHGHDRNYELLNVDTCKDLIDGFERIGQQFPVIARPLKEKHPDFDYEIIVGARRHWTSTYRNKTRKESLLVEVRNLDDEMAFVLQDAENRDRKETDE